MRLVVGQREKTCTVPTDRGLEGRFSDAGVQMERASLLTERRPPTPKPSARPPSDSIPCRPAIAARPSPPSHFRSARRGQMPEAVLVWGVRTPFAKAFGELQQLSWPLLGSGPLFFLFASMHAPIWRHLVNMSEMGCAPLGDWGWGLGPGLCFRICNTPPWGLWLVKKLAGGIPVISPVGCPLLNFPC